MAYILGSTQMSSAIRWLVLVQPGLIKPWLMAQHVGWTLRFNMVSANRGTGFPHPFSSPKSFPSGISACHATSRQKPLLPHPDPSHVPVFPSRRGKDLSNRGNLRMGKFKGHFPTGSGSGRRGFPSLSFSLSRCFPALSLSACGGGFFFPSAPPGIQTLSP